MTRFCASMISATLKQVNERENSSDNINTDYNLCGIHFLYMLSVCFLLMTDQIWNMEHVIFEAQFILKNTGCKVNPLQPWSNLLSFLCVLKHLRRLQVIPQLLKRPCGVTTTVRSSLPLRTKQYGQWDGVSWFLFVSLSRKQQANCQVTSKFLLWQQAQRGVWLRGIWSSIVSIYIEFLL